MFYPNQGNFLLPAMASVFIGGTSIAGGAGSIRKALGFLKPTDMLGKTYTFKGYQNKNGKNGGFVSAIKMPDGKLITMWYQDRDPNAN